MDNKIGGKLVRLVKIPFLVKKPPAYREFWDSVNAILSIDKIKLLASKEKKTT